jgi:multidrug resistance efflux pump
VIRAEYSPGSEMMANLSVVSSTPSVRSHILSIPNLPSLAGLVVEIGDYVDEGQLIARYVDDHALDTSEEEVKAAQERIPELEEAIELERAAHEAKLEGLRQSLADAREKVERKRYLVERDAAPRSELVSAAASLRQAEQAVMIETTGWTSRLNNLQTQLRQARLTISRAERKRQGELEKQWVRTPVAGLVSDIRLAGVSTKGVDLEVMVLEQQVEMLAHSDLEQHLQEVAQR